MSASTALNELARDATRFADDWPGRAADLIGQEARQQLMRDTGDGRFSRSNMSAGRVDVDDRRGTADVTARGGVWTWLEEGTRAHTVTAGAGKVLSTPYGPRPAVRVRGLTARRTWTRAVTASLPHAERQAEAMFDRMVPLDG